MDDRSQIKKVMALSISVYLFWFISTYLLEGRILTLLRPEAAADRIAFTVTANIFVGIIIAGIIGFILFIIQNPPSLNPILIMNVYAQVLTVSVAEVVVCWAVIGAGFESLTRNKGKVISLLTGIFAAGISFGLYHFAHSPPFNQINMVLLMMIVSFATSIVYFIGRDIYAAIVFHNTLALFGVMQALEKSGNLISFSQPVYPLIAMALVSIIILVIFDILYIRRKREVIE